MPQHISESDCASRILATTLLFPPHGFHALPDGRDLRDEPRFVCIPQELSHTTISIFLCHKHPNKKRGPPVGLVIVCRLHLQPTGTAPPPQQPTATVHCTYAVTRVVTVTDHRPRLVFVELRRRHAVAKRLTLWFGLRLSQPARCWGSVRWSETRILTPDPPNFF